MKRQDHKNPIGQIVLASAAILSGLGVLLEIMTPVRADLPVAAANAGPLQEVNATRVDILSPGCQMTSTLILAAYQAWHGLPNHLQPPPYISTDPDVISNHIRKAQRQCIDGFIVDWYGPPAGLANDGERGFIDQATAELHQQATALGFKMGLMYDEGTLSHVTAFTTTRVISDLLYARQYFTMSNYLTISGQPILFVFPYPDVDSQIDWSSVRQQLGISITLLEEGPNPKMPDHDVQFDGFYAWVQATPWIPNSCADWGENYLKWFYGTMLGPDYQSKLMVGGVWPGFDDSRASWGEERCMDRRCGQTWRDTWDLAKQFQPPIVLVETWNDFEEGTDIEYGVSPRSAWREDFDPLNRALWTTPSAVWEDVSGPTAILRENNPTADFGKVETTIIAANVDRFPFLLVNATAVDQGASYTIQILDKRTDTPRDLLKNITSPGSHLINLAQEMGWHGVQSFTINIWIGGEGKSVTFDLVSVQADCRSYLPTILRQGLHHRCYDYAGMQAGLATPQM